ncbi:MAG: class I SAM-dependent methyltransferase [Thermodesulfobacteriota bacterium]|nr:class I SAM-dependent methyltransferase [Thermodesulfobacteriota bacterium]
MSLLKEVKDFWEKHPLLSYELDVEPGTKEFFAAYNPIRDDVEKFCSHLFEFGGCGRSRILDVGCGNGWLLWNYARRGAQTTGLDLTKKGIEICRKRFEYEGLSGDFLCGNAEELPFGDGSFDMVTSLGVIHHTPETEKCAREIIRVTRPGGKVVVCIYFRNILLRNWSFPLIRSVMRVLGMDNSRHDPQGIRDRAKGSPEELVRSYDGPDNPLGKVFSRSEAMKMFEGLVGLRTEVHYFPKRFIPALHSIHFPLLVEKILDRHFGIMLYIIGNKGK